MNLRTIAAAVLATAACFAQASAQQTPAIFPFDPAQLLGVLPAAPEGWKVIRSEADLTLGEWVQTRAIRVFQAPPAPAAAGAPEVPLGEVEISVVDTAGFIPSLSAFAGFTPAKSGNLEKKLIGALPAIVITNENGRQFVQVLVSARYLVELTLTNLPNRRVEDWLRTFHFESLPDKSNTPASKPREFRVTHLDELQPKNNRSYAVSTTNTKRVDAFLKSLPPSAPEPASP